MKQIEEVTDAHGGWPINSGKIGMDQEKGKGWKKGSYQLPLHGCLMESVNRWRSDREASWINELGTDDIVEKFEKLWPIIDPLTKQEISRKIERTW